MAANQTTNNNSIRSILDKEKLNGSNFLDWYRNLRIVLRNEQKLHHLEEALPEAPSATATVVVRNAYTRRVAEQQEVACLMLVSMTLEIQKNLEDRPAFEILQELKTMFEQQAKQELFETVKAFHACKVEEEQSQYIWHISDGIFEIDMHNHISNERSIYTCSNKKTKHNLDSTFLWHCRLGHINKKRIEKLQQDGLLKSIKDESFDVCVSRISGKMARKPFTHASERADDLLGIIHSDVCGPFRTTSREAPKQYGFYIDAEEHELGDHEEPPNYQAASSDLESKKWLEAMNAEMQSMKDNQVWNLVDLHPNCKTVGSKWLFKKKTGRDGNIHTYKARLVAKGFTQTYAVDYVETFLPVADIKAIRILIAIAAYYDYAIWQMDAKTAFLNGRLNEDVYLEASRRWNTRFDEEIKKCGFSQNPDEPCVYKRAGGSIIVFLILYVNDILLMGNNIPMLQDVRSWLGRCFAMKDLDLSKSQGPSTLAGVKQMKGIPYALIVGSIMYAVRCTRLDVAFSHNLTSRYQQNPGESHWTAVKNILKYLKNTKDMLLVYGGDSTIELGVTCYTDASWESDRDDLRSQMGFVFVMNGGDVAWKSSKQSTTVMSSMEAEYIAAAEAAMEAIWIRAITIADEPGVQKGGKHFQRKYHFIREVIQEGDIRILKVHTDNNFADPLTKPMPCTIHVEHSRIIGLRPPGSFM
uniref:Reverse transcriptase Ty1/copia-type domain-containing protein n=1 Tax=Tanacetum cinerariifolium TaxID=118510 RepID=A0A699GWQ4_TANCI|nr:hypothetical protein [Tanacetum cinerariifolium]